MDNQIVTSSPTHQTVSSAWISLVVSVVILGMKFGAFSLTHSQAVFSDALESIVNVITAFIAVAVMRAVAQPADEDHPYGHGKLEYFSSAFEGGMIAFAALAIAYEAFKALMSQQPVHELESGMIVVAAAAILNLLLALHLRVVGKKYNSEALLASGAHVMSDVLTTVGVLTALVLVKVTGLVWIDPAVALLVALQLGYSGAKIVRQAAGSLIDEVDRKSLRSLCDALNQHKSPGLIDVHNLRVIRAGRFHHVDAHLVVPDFWDALKLHTAAHDFEKAVVATYPYEGEFAFHVDPCRREFCSICDYHDCPIRSRPFHGVRPLTVESIIRPAMKDL